MNALERNRGEALGGGEGEGEGGVGVDAVVVMNALERTLSEALEPIDGVARS